MAGSRHSKWEVQPIGSQCIELESSCEFSSALEPDSQTVYLIQHKAQASHDSWNGLRATSAAQDRAKVSSAVLAVGKDAGGQLVKLLRHSASFFVPGH
eukprot:4692887-Amphidinium_carterae.1